MTTRYDKHKLDELVEICYDKAIHDIVRDDIKIEVNRRLIIAINEFNKNSSEQTKEVIRLTKWLMWLTIVIGALTLISVVPIIFKYLFTLL